MSLYKQLTILITVFLIFVLSIILIFVIKYNKDTIENQLSSNAQNSASFLGLTISKNVALDDTPIIEGMLASIVDTGFYKYIAIYDIDSKEIIKVENPKKIEKIPLWFSNIFSIKGIKASAEIMKGWILGGHIEVKIDHDYANAQLWKTFKTVSQIFLILTIVLLIILYIFINNLLKPLKKLNIQAKAIDNNEFLIEKELPKTQEFKQVVLAMNKTISKMEIIFNKEVETLNKYNELIYKHNETGLGNRNYLILKLNNYLKNSHGLLTFIDIKDEISFKKKVGYKSYMDIKQFIIKQINNRISLNKSIVFSVLNDGAFAILLPNTYYEDVEYKLMQIHDNIYKHIKSNKLDELFKINIAIGTSNYNQGNSLKDILSKTDQALSLAMQGEFPKVKYIQEKVKHTKQEWIELLQWAFENDGIVFETQNIVDIKNKSVYMQEYYTRIKDKQGLIYSPGDFLSVVISMAWIEQLEKKIMQKIFASKSLDKTNTKAVINLTTKFILSKDNVDWLVEILKNTLKNSNTIFYFECQNSEIFANLKAYKYFTQELAKTSHKFAIESFSFENKNLDYLKFLKPDYLKISKTYLIDTSDITNSILSNITSALGSKLIVKHIETQKEFEKLKHIGIQYMQGRYIDKMEKIDGS